MWIHNKKNNVDQKNLKPLIYFLIGIDGMMTNKRVFKVVSRIETRNFSFEKSLQT